MIKPTSDIAFTPAVKSVQERFGSRKSYSKMEERGGFQTEITSDLAGFISERDSFYLGTANAEGQPYIQHRGGPKGFLKVLDNHTLGFADFTGNKQYISVGNLSENDKAYIFLMDYAARRRIKLWGTAEVTEDEAILEQLRDEGYPAKIERAILFHIKAWDINCPQHITQRYSKEELEPTLEDFRKRIKELTEENQKLKEELKRRQK